MPFVGCLILNMNPLRILLIDDHTLFRSGMRLVLQEGIADVHVLEAASLEQAVRQAEHPPSLVLLDIQLQGVNGLEGLGLLRQRWPKVPVVMLSSILDRDTIRQAIARGAVAFVSKADTAEKIIQVVRSHLSRGSATSAFTAPGKEASAKPVKPHLSPRQCEVLDLLCEGLSNKVIAQRMGLSEFTVRGHVQAVLNLLDVTSRSQATFAARNAGLIG